MLADSSGYDQRIQPPLTPLLERDYGLSITEPPPALITPPLP